MKRIFILLPILLLVLSFSNCKREKPDNRERGLIYSFYPRPCEHILLVTPIEQGVAVSGHQFQLTLLTGQNPMEYFRGSDGEVYPEVMFRYKQIAYDVRTYGGFTNIPMYGSLNKAPLSIHNRRLEQELELDYSTFFGDKGSRHSSGGKNYANLISIQYRTTGVRDIKVSADKALWGVASGQSLNEHLKIVGLIPKQIISSESECLLIGYKSQQEVTSISEWLSLKPMAQPGMWLSFKSTPEELSDTPMDIKFTVELTTNEGVVLTDTLDVKLIK